MSSESTSWVSQRAVAWVLDEAPAPAELIPTLIAIARRCDENGRGSCQSPKTIAGKTGKSVDQVVRDIKKLRELGLLALGDQGLPARLGLPRGQWPTVYDVPLHVRGPKPTKASKNKSGSSKPEETSCMDAPPASMPTPGMHAPPPPASMQEVPPACMPPEPPAWTPPKQTSNKPVQSINPRRGSRSAARLLRERFGQGLTDSVIAYVIAEADRRAAIAGRPIDSLTRYLDSWKPGELADVVGEALDQEDARASPPLPHVRAVSDWCGQCTEDKRQRHDDQERPYRCPDCHPLAERRTA